MRALIYILAFTCLCGCSPPSLNSDFSVRLTRDYYLIQTSPDLTEVYNRKVGPDGGVPAKVIQIAWNNNLILAKQQELQNRRLFPGDRFKVPAPGKFEWWIIDARIGTRYGPMDEAEFLTKVKALGEETLKLQNVSDVKGKEFAQ